MSSESRERRRVQDERLYLKQTGISAKGSGQSEKEE